MGSRDSQIETVESTVSDTLLKHGCLCEAYTKRSLHEIKS